MLFNRDGNPDDFVDHQMSTEHSQYIMEAYLGETLSPDELSMFLESPSEVDDAVRNGILMEKSIVRLDKTAKLSKARKMAIFTIAAEKKDPKYKKLITCWKIERFLEDFLDKKYGNEASRRAKKSVSAAAKKSSSNIIKKAAAKAKSKFTTNPAKK